MESSGEKFNCVNCEIELIGDDDFCPNCGTVFIEDVYCTNHNDIDAEGVCVICAHAFCGECGGKYENKFLCSEHESYEIYQNMVRVYGTSNEADIRYTADCFKKADLHPFIFSRKASPMHLGGSDYSLFRASGDSANHIINEIKLLVPFSEVLQAEEVLKELEEQNNNNEFEIE